MTKRLFVHVGTEKTGTTFIQDFIAHHKRELKREGLMFFDAGTESNHHYWLAKALGFRFAPTPVDEKKEQQALSDCRAFLKKHPDEDFLLTSEHFDFNPNPENIKAFADFFAGYEINIVIFLRDQVSYCQSLYAEHIKWGGVLDFSEFIKRTIKQGRYSYLEKYQSWEQFADHVIVVDYNAVRNNLLPAFLEAIGFEYSEFTDSRGTSKINPTPSMDFLNVVRLLNNGVCKSERRQFYIDLLKLVTQKHPQLLERHDITLPLKFKTFFEQELHKNSHLATLLDRDPEDFLGPMPDDNLYQPESKGQDLERILRQLIFSS